MNSREVTEMAQARAQALINYKLSKNETFTADWVVDVVEKMKGVTPHMADQAAAYAMASPTTAEARELWKTHPAGFAEALRAEINRLDELERKGLGL